MSYEIEIRQAGRSGYLTAAESNAYYKTRYARDNYIVHWWGAPGQVGTHDATVNYILGKAATGDMSVNYVVSNDKITMIVPPDMVSFGSGPNGNPTGVNVEHSPYLNDEGYKRAGWLKLQLEQRWGKRLAIRKHSDFMQTACPGTIDTARIQQECDRWRDNYYSTAAPVSAPAPAPAAPPTPTYEVVETYPNGKEIVLNKNANLWGMNYRELKYMSEHPVEAHNAGERWVVTNKVRHVNGYHYYRRAGQVDGFNVLDCDNYVAPAPAPVPEPAKSPIGGLPPYEVPKAEKLTLVTSIMAFDSASGAEQHNGVAIAVGPGDYFVHEKRGMAWRLSDDNRIDRPWWINTADNKVEEPAPEPELPPTIEPEPIPQVPPEIIDQMHEVPAFKLVLHYLNTDKSAVKYKAINQVPVEVVDFISNKKAVMAEYNKVEGIIKPVPVVAWFTGPDGQKYYLAQQVYIKGQGYGIRHDLLVELKKRTALDFNGDGRVNMDDIAQLGGYIETAARQGYQAAGKFFQDAIKVEHKLNLSDKTVDTYNGVKQKVIDGIQFRGKVKK